MDVVVLYEYDGESFDRTLAYYAKGNSAPAEFIKAMEEEHYVTCLPASVRFTHARLVPTGAKGCQLFRECKPGRGAFPALYVNADATRPIEEECLVCDSLHSDLEFCGGESTEPVRRNDPPSVR